MRYVTTFLLSCIFSFSIEAIAQGQDREASVMQQLTVQEQSEYQERLGNASGEQQKREIQNEYQKMVKTRAQTSNGAAGSQQGTGVGKGQGKGGAHSQQGGGAQGGQAGGKNKSQKSGK